MRQPFNKVSLPNDARGFISFMDKVWEGGDLYDEYHHAVTTARWCGAVQTGNTTYKGERNWYVFRFPGDNNECSVLIFHDGRAIQFSGYPFRPWVASTEDSKST